MHSVALTSGWTRGGGMRGRRTVNVEPRPTPGSPPEPNHRACRSAVSPRTSRFRDRPANDRAYARSARTGRRDAARAPGQCLPHCPALPSEGAQEACDEQVEAIPRFDWTDFQDRWSRAEQSLELWHEGYQELSIRRHRLLDAHLPCVQSCFRLRQQLPDEALERLRQARERDASLKLIELARRVISMTMADGWAEVLHEGRLPDSGPTRDEHQLSSSRTGSRKRVGERLQCLVTTIQLVGDAQPARDLVRGDWKRLNRCRLEPLSSRFAEIVDRAVAD
jgi:hypothetical protein